MRRRLVLSAIPAFLLVFAYNQGCKDEPRYPTAKAPPTLKNISKNRAKAADQDDDDDDEGPSRPYDRAHRPPTHRPQESRGKPARSTAETGARARSFTLQGARTINGHPKGPKAEVFNAVMNSVMPRVARCFQDQADNLGDKSFVNVRLRVARNGRVGETTVVSGTSNPKVRSCVTSAIKGLVFPVYEGPEVTQVVPFAVK